MAARKLGIQKSDTTKVVKAPGLLAAAEAPLLQPWQTVYQIRPDGSRP